MLKLTKETLAELTTEDLASVVGGDALWASCLAASCITSGGTVIEIKTSFTTWLTQTGGEL